MIQKIGLYTKNIDNVWFGVACDEEQVYATSFAKNEESVLESLQDCMPVDREWQVLYAPSVLAEKALVLVKNVYDGKGEIGNVTLATDRLSPFYRKVLEVTRLIPVGYVTSYGAVSEAAGGGPRAVGGVMAANPFAPIVPCHRVVKSDFTLGGYGGGLRLKTEMLSREKRGNNLPKEIQVGERQLQVFPVERVLDKLQK